MSKTGLGENPLASFNANPSGQDESLGWIGRSPARGVSVIEIPVDSIDPNPEQPRKHFIEASLQELANPIKDKGVLQPVAVRAGSNGRYTLIMGERRWQASKLAGLKTLPALIRADGGMLELALIENLQRESLHPVDEAEALRALKAQHDYTDEVLAKVVAKNKTWVTTTIALNRLPDEIKQKAREANYGVRDVLIGLSREKDAARVQKLFKKALAGELTVTSLRDERRKEKPAGERPYRHHFAPPDQSFDLSIVFKKNRVDKSDIRQALEMALESLKTLGANSHQKEVSR